MSIKEFSTWGLQEWKVFYRNNHGEESHRVCWVATEEYARKAFDAWMQCNNYNFQILRIEPQYG